MGKEAKDAGRRAPKKVKRVDSETMGESMYPAQFVYGQQDTGVSDLLQTIGGLGREIEAGTDPILLVNRVAHAIEAAVAPSGKVIADPPPSDYMAMMRLVEYFCRTDGDVFQSIAIPAEVILKDVNIECEDTGAKKEWERLWLETLDINECYCEIYWGSEKDGQSFPLEVYDGTELVGVAFIEPTSMWVGNHITHSTPQTALIVPENFPLEKFKSMVHPLAYSSFVTDQNTQTIRAQRVEIKPERMTPVFAHKQRWQRYAVPHIARAARNIMHRQVLEEYRRGTIEKFMSQMWLFTVGNKDFPASPQKVSKIRNLISNAAKNRSNALVVDHLVAVENISPKTLDDLLGNNTFASQRQLIFADLGFSIFLVSGEVPGTSGRGGGQQVEVDLQLAIERWQYKRGRFIKWATEVSKKYAREQGGKELAKKLPSFVVDTVGVQQMQAIKERVMPYLTAGKLSNRTALKAGGYSYDRELANKKEEEKDSRLFLPAPSFMQGVVGPDGKSSATAHGQNGRPTLGQKPQQKRSNEMKASSGESGELEILASAESFEVAIESHFQDYLNTRDAAAFGQWLKSSLESEMSKAFQDGYRDWGGRNLLDANVVNSAPQGIAFQMDRADMLMHDLRDSANPVQLRPRALMYAEASHYAYVLGTQQAMKDHGATGWVRVLHPELSLWGPCAQCAADALVVHEMEELYSEFHPGGVCTTRSVQYFFGSGNRIVRVPEMRRRVIRR